MPIQQKHRSLDPFPPSNFPKISIHTLWGTLLRIIMVRNLGPPWIIFAHQGAHFFNLENVTEVI